MTGVPPPTYVCRKCNVPGHYIQNCPMSSVPLLGMPHLGDPMQTQLSSVPGNDTYAHDVQQYPKMDSAGDVQQGGQ